VDGVDVNIVKDTDKAGSGISVLDSEIGSSNREVALRAFHTITEKLGKGKPEPTYRGEPPAKLYRNDIALSEMRHREFRHAPNLTKDQLKPFKETIERCCAGFMRRNSALLRKHAYDIDDIRTYALVWTHIFAHKSIPVSPTINDGKDTERLLSSYLKQRFGQFYNTLKSKTDSTCPDTETAYVCLTGEVGEVLSTSDPQEEDSETKPMSKKKAKERLNSKLAAMDHQKLVDSLRENSVSPSRDFATRKLALRLLRQHTESCPSCLANE